MDFWQTILATIIGGGITLAATVITNKHQIKIERNRRIIEKLEHAHGLIIAIERIYRARWASDLNSLASGKHDAWKQKQRKTPISRIRDVDSVLCPVSNRKNL